MPLRAIGYGSFTLASPCVTLLCLFTIQHLQRSYTGKELSHMQVVTLADTSGGVSNTTANLMPIMRRWTVARGCRLWYCGTMSLDLEGLVRINGNTEDWDRGPFG
jgi:hypothetical protein